jgi:hypothetical protein
MRRRPEGVTSILENVTSAKVTLENGGKQVAYEIE